MKYLFCNLLAIQECADKHMAHTFCDQRPNCVPVSKLMEYGWAYNQKPNRTKFFGFLVSAIQVSWKQFSLQNRYSLLSPIDFKDSLPF